MDLIKEFFGNDLRHTAFFAVITGDIDAGVSFIIENG